MHQTFGLLAVFALAGGLAAGSNTYTNRRAGCPSGVRAAQAYSHEPCVSSQKQQAGSKIANR